MFALLWQKTPNSQKIISYISLELLVSRETAINVDSGDRNPSRTHKSHLLIKRSKPVVMSLGFFIHVLCTTEELGYFIGSTIRSARNTRTQQSSSDAFRDGNAQIGS